MVRVICLGIGLNMFFQEWVSIIDAPPQPKEIFHKPGFQNRVYTKVKGYKVPHLTRMQNK